ncbi:putative sulfate exporter family transporter [Priestia filamentosa]|nr:putative sulfate exporter family transporter [Priestia filamentosa]
MAHVIAAFTPFSQEAVEAALIVKLSRVLMLVPIAFIVGLFFNKNKETPHCTTITFPWFIIRFLIMSFLNMLELFTKETRSYLQTIAYLLISMAMGALRLQVRIEIIIKNKKSAFFACLFDSFVLYVAGFLLVFWTH